MSCQFYQKESGKYHEGKLSDDLRIKFESHLQQCTECAESYKIDSLADSIINQEKEINPDSNLTFRIMNRIGELDKHEKTISISFKRFLQPALIITSVAASIFFGVIIGNIYKPAGTVNSIPLELSLADDEAIEWVYLLSNE